MADAEKSTDETAAQPQADGAPAPSDASPSDAAAADAAPVEDRLTETEAAAADDLAGLDSLEPDVHAPLEVETDAPAEATQADAPVSETAPPPPAEDPQPAADAPPAPEPALTVETAPEPLSEPVPEPVATPPSPGAAEAGAGAAAAAATVAAAAARRPIWSDHGDAPFDDRPGKAEKMSTPRETRSDDGGDGRSAGNETLEILKTIVFALAIAFVLRVLLLQPFTIPSASMEPNLYEGDYIVVSKWSYGYSKHSIPWSPPLFEGRILGSAPKRGDIVVFKLPRDDRTDYIKRVIGLPGDRIQMINNVLHINGRAVADAEVARAQIDGVFGPQPVVRARETLPEGRSFTIQDFGPGNDLDDTEVYEVPQGYYFMMGDNRDNSIDSRVEQSAGVGLVPEENLVGKAEIILFSWSPGASLWNPVSWFANLRPSRFFTVLH